MTQVTLYPSADSEVQNDSPDFNNGTADALGSGDENTTNTDYRSYLTFDLSPIKPGSIIEAVTLKLTIAEDKSGNVRTKEIYRANGAWTETGITWNNQPGPVGSALGSVSYSASESVGTVKSYTLTATEIQNMLDGTYLNNGFEVLTQTENDDHYRHYSRENGTASNRPQLVVDYTEVGGSLLALL